MTTLEETRKQVLLSALNAREQEVMHYQINIDNYTMALEEISQLPEEEAAILADFAKQLKGLLDTEKLEQKKAKIMLRVMQNQVR